MSTNSAVNIKLTDKEVNLILKLREVPFGKVDIYMQNKQPIRIEKITESILL